MHRVARGRSVHIPRSRGSYNLGFDWAIRRDRTRKKTIYKFIHDGSKQKKGTAASTSYARAGKPGRKPRAAVPCAWAYGATRTRHRGPALEKPQSSHLPTSTYARLPTGYYTCGSARSVSRPGRCLSNCSTPGPSRWRSASANSGVVGRQLGRPFLSIHDNGLHPGNIGDSSFDGEGTPVSRLGLDRRWAFFSHFMPTGGHRPCLGVAPPAIAGLGPIVGGAKLS